MALYSSNKTFIYFIPGMAAGPEIFNNIRFPKSKYEVKILEWLIPMKEETLKEYAKRMAKRITEPNPILIGVSFGGIVAQEMNEFLNFQKIIIISSVKKRQELPKRMKIAGATKLYKLIPTSLVLSREDLTKFSVGPKSKKRLRMYQKYLHVRDPYYLDWSIKQIVTWSRKKTIPGLIHIQGDRDKVFPMKRIQCAIVVKGGTHIMIINRGREISKILLNIFNESTV